MLDLFSDNYLLQSVNIILYPQHDNSQLLLWAPNLFFERELESNNFYRLTQKTQLGILSWANYLNKINPGLFDFGFSSFKKIASKDDSPLLIIIRNEEYFFEVSCESLIGDGFMSFSTYGRIEFFSHKYSEEDMKVLFNKAIDNSHTAFRSNPSVDILCIDRMDKIEDIEKLNAPEKLVKKVDQLYSSEEVFNIFPAWTGNLENELKCDIYSIGRSIRFLIKYNDFTPLYHTDRDGGWYVYTHEEEVIGEIHFQTYFSIQEYLLNISNLDGISFESTNDFDILDCKYPFVVKGVLHFSCSVSHLFFILGINKYKTIARTQEHNYDSVENGWVHGWTRPGLWPSKYDPIDEIPF